MNNGRLGAWLRRLRVTATIVSVAAACLAVAMLVLAFIPKSPVMLGLPVGLLSGLDEVVGVEPGVVADPDGTLVLKVTDPTLAQRLLYLATMLPGLLLIAEIARRLAGLLRAAQDSDPFTAQTARELSVLAKLTVAGGLAAFVADLAAQWLLSTTMLTSGAAAEPQVSPLGWLAVGLVFAAFGQLIGRGVAMRSELDTVI